MQDLALARKISVASTLFRTMHTITAFVHVRGRKRRLPMLNTNRRIWRYAQGNRRNSVYINLERRIIYQQVQSAPRVFNAVVKLYFQKITADTDDEIDCLQIGMLHIVALY